MSTLWWLVVLWLACSFSCGLGWAACALFGVRARVYDLDFTRRRVGT